MIHVVDAAPASTSHILAGHTKLIHSLSLDAEGGRLATSSLDGTVRLWDVTKGKQVTTFTGHKGSVLRVEFSPDGQWVAGGALDGTTMLWRSDRSAAMQGFLSDSPLAWAFSPDSRYLAFPERNGRMRVWDLKEDRSAGDFDRAGQRAISMQYSRDGKRLLTSGNNELMIWVPETGDNLLTVPLPESDDTGTRATSKRFTATELRWQSESIAP
jgi:WD40 repeat protein